MSNFQRCKSKIWWPTYLEEEAEEENEEDKTNAAFSHLSVNCGNWTRETSLSRSSCSPSNGSQRSQDSGFSDSESSPTILANAEAHSTNSLPDKAASGGSTTPIIKKTNTECHLDKGKWIPEVQNAGGVVESSKSNCNSNSDFAATPFYPHIEAPSLDVVSLNDTVRKYGVHFSLPFDNGSSSSLSTRLLNFEYRTANDFLQNSSSSDVTSEECSILDRSCIVTSDNKLLTTPDSNVSKNHDVSCMKSILLRTDDHSEYQPEEPQHLSSSEEGTRKYKLSAESITTVNSELFIAPVHTSTPKKKNGISETGSSCSHDYVDDAEVSFDLSTLYWLKEIRSRYEPEAMVTLQSKSICCYRSSTSQQNMSFEPSANSIQVYYEEAKTITEAFSHLYRVMKSSMCEQIQLSAILQSLLGRITRFLVNYAILLPKICCSFAINQQFALLMELCDRFKLTLRCRCLTFGSSLLDEVDTLGRAFSFFVNALLILQVQALLSSMENAKDEQSLLKFLDDILHLVREVDYIRQLVASMNATKLLVNVYEENGATSLAVCRTVLQTLAVICGDADRAAEFQEAGGLDALLRTLKDPTLCKHQTMVVDVVSVLAQITSTNAVATENNANFELPAHYLQPIIFSLIRFLSFDTEDELLLLITVTLVNLSCSTQHGQQRELAVSIMLKCDAIEKLISAIKEQSRQVSVFVQEEVSKLLASVATMQEARAYLAEHRAVIPLLCFLRVGHPILQNTQSETEAMHRLQYKSVLALTSLCNNADICHQMVELDGVRQLVALCKDERKRNYRDDVLIACISALRKIATSCGKSVVNESDGKELIEPRFVDSYLLYSSRKESYV